VDEINTFRLAVKGFIVDDGDLLVLQRIEDEVQAAGIWELPGGRLEPGEDPFDGLRREIDEETGLSVDPVRPLTVRHFDRDDGQTITMIVFHCTAAGRDVSVRESEHSRSKWVPLADADDRLDTFFHRELDAYRDL
jgi:8-oxo-dGTP diphosphatase